jgi:hypothetical protein
VVVERSQTIPTYRRREAFGERCGRSREISLPNASPARYAVMGWGVGAIDRHCHREKSTECFAYATGWFAHGAEWFGLGGCRGNMCDRCSEFIS